LNCFGEGALGHPQAEIRRLALVLQFRINHANPAHLLLRQIKWTEHLVDLIGLLTSFRGPRWLGVLRMRSGTHAGQRREGEAGDQQRTYFVSELHNCTVLKLDHCV
jgi:hypothetical protein